MPIITTTDMILLTAARNLRELREDHPVDHLPDARRDDYKPLFIYRPECLGDLESSIMEYLITGWDEELQVHAEAFAEAWRNLVHYIDSVSEFDETLVRRSVTREALEWEVFYLTSSIKVQCWQKVIYHLQRALERYDYLFR